MPLVSELHAVITRKNNKWLIENLDVRFGTFLNNQPIENGSAKQIQNGDIIFIMGLKIIFVGEYLFINNPFNEVKFNQASFVLSEKEEVEENFSSNEEKNLSEVEMYSERDYFYRAPRIRNIIEHEKIKIDPPPAAEKGEDVPVFLTLGTTISAGIMMIVSTYASLSGMLSNNGSSTQIITSIVIAIIMLISTMVLPIMMNRYQKSLKKQKEQKRQNRYKKYIDMKMEEIDRVMEKQKNTLRENYITPEECGKIVVNKDSRLWERKVDDYDFLNIRLGLGDVDLDAEIIYPEEKFTMEDDNLVDILNQVVNKSKTIENAPITLSLMEKNNSAIIEKNENMMNKFIQGIMMQLITFHSYEDLKLVFLLKNRSTSKWDYVKNFPHIWDNTKQFRFFATSFSEMLEISKYLEEEFQNREVLSSNNEHTTALPYYLIITDDPERVKNLTGITEICRAKKNLGFSTLFITDNIVELPNECKTFISVESSEKGELFESEISSKTVKEFNPDIYSGDYFTEVLQMIGNIPIKMNSSKTMLLPNSYTFLEMYHVGRIEQLNILERWKLNDSTISLRAPVGVDGLGMTIMLDVHEKYHGPHGLIAGSTGSGKSEFIITYILSLAINYHPDDVSFLLIDYKGGGLAGAFKKKDIVLPHLVGTITNIDKVGLQRSLDSIQSELRRRQIMFNEARNMTEESTIDIYKYQKLYHEGVVKKPIPHLLIICDEFAELKQQQEDFMNELISVARIGRSLGVHLILATQKPAGIVNDQIRSNSRFGICLKVQDREDSMDVIKRPDAVNIKRAGQFYMQVGNNEYFVLGQSGWSGALYFPTDIAKKEIDTSMEFIANTGNVVKKVDNVMQKKVSSSGDQITNIVRYMSQLAKAENIKLNQLWLDNVPAVIYSNDIQKKYKVKIENNVIAPVIGEYDDPYNQKQGVVRLNFNEDGNMIIFGSAESGKETLLSTCIYEIMTTHSPEEVVLYIFDFGSESLKIFNGSPNIGDIVFLDEKEKISRFFEMLKKEIKNRKEVLFEYNGDYELYLKSNHNPLPRIITIINNYEAFTETYEYEYEEIFQSLTREGIKFGITFVVTANSQSDVRYRLLQNFKKQIALQMNNDDDYYSIFDRIGKKRPSHLFGRGLIEMNKEIYEFQTARICQAEEYTDFIKEKINELKEQHKVVAQRIPTLPNEVKVEDVVNHLESLSGVPIGINKEELSVCLFNFQKNFVNMIASQNVENTAQFVFNLMKEITQKLLYVNVAIFDAEEVIQENKNMIKEAYEKFISGIKSNSKECYLGIIIGIDKFLNIIEKDDRAFENDLKEMNNHSNCNIIIVDNATKIKNHAFDSWYQTYIQSDMGIWIGNGINDQYTLTIFTSNRNLVNNCGNQFGYAIVNGEVTMIKLLGATSKEERNE